MRMGNEYAVERTMGRTETGKCQSKTHKTYRGTLTLWIAAFIMIAGLSIALGSNLVSAHDKSEQPEQKFYKSIEIKEGDGESLKNTEVMTTILFMTILMKSCLLTDLHQIRSTQDNTLQ